MCERSKGCGAGVLTILLLSAALLHAAFCACGCGTGSASPGAGDPLEAFVVEEVQRGEPLSGPDEMMQAALELARARIPGVAGISEHEAGAEGQRFYTLQTQEGGNAGWIGIDIYGDLLSFLDFTTAPDRFTQVNLDEKQAAAVAEGMLEGLGFEAGSLKLLKARLRETGAVGPPQDT
ncbi:MAG: hypothetical protein HPY75_00155 [Actinobacteria bacterium]|nr:hypothetical protein [Actinomycetota bacterium]